MEIENDVRGLKKEKVEKLREKKSEDDKEESSKEEKKEKKKRRNTIRLLKIIGNEMKSGNLWKKCTKR